MLGSGGPWPAAGRWWQRPLAAASLLGLAVDWIVGINVVRAALVTLGAAGYGWVMWWQTKLALSGQPFLKG